MSDINFLRCYVYRAIHNNEFDTIFMIFSSSSHRLDSSSICNMNIFQICFGIQFNCLIISYQIQRALKSCNRKWKFQQVSFDCIKYNVGIDYGIHHFTVNTRVIWNQQKIERNSARFVLSTTSFQSTHATFFFIFKCVRLHNDVPKTCKLHGKKIKILRKCDEDKCVLLWIMTMNSV